MLVDGIAMGSVRPAAELLSDVDVYVDGSVVEVYFGGEVVTKVVSATSQDVSIRLDGLGQAMLHLDAWRMDSSITSAEN